ncbi:MAG: ATP-binding cassette domain-containing protein [Syntrophobacteraceae bacterium]
MPSSSCWRSCLSGLPGSLDTFACGGFETQLATHHATHDPLRRIPFLPRDWRWLLFLGVILGILSQTVANSYVFLLLNVIALNAIVVLGLNLFIASSGQVSLGHAAFYGLGAYLSAIASTTWQWPLPAALLFSLVVVAATAFCLALPTLRLEGHYLVMATLGFNIIVSILMGQLESWTGGPSGFPSIPKLRLGPWVLGSDRQFFFFIWAVLLALSALALNLMDSRLGRSLHAIHEQALTASAVGIPAFRYKVILFVISALYAAVAGFCYAHYVTFISPKSFDIFYSVQTVTMVAVGGMGNLWGGLAGVVVLTCLPEVLHTFEDVHVLLYGLILMGALVFCPEGLLPALTSLLRIGRRSPADIPSPEARRARGDDDLLLPVSDRVHGNLTDTPLPVGEPSRSLLSLESISLSFGGIQALNEVSLEVQPGEILALIGPNGAGKTTFLNVVSGLIKPDSGQAVLNGTPFLNRKPHEIAASGIGRTFQTAQIYGHMTALENVLLGCHIHGRAGFAATSLHVPWEREEEFALIGRAMALLKVFGLSERAFASGRQLSLLEYKLVELARALALQPSVMLLDEPVGGLNPRESRELVHYVSLLKRGGMGIILVEHDMNVVMSIADRIVVLQHGARIATGTPREIQQNPKVIAAYLGTKKNVTDKPAC